MTDDQDDRRHQATCDWNLYKEYRATDPDLCNIDCLNRPEDIAKSWAMLDAITARNDGSREEGT